MTDEELGTMTQRHTRARDSVASAHKDRGVLLTEVERLRAEVAAERAAVVAWLRAAPTARMWQQAPMDDAAASIERGEHRREEEK